MINSKINDKISAVIENPAYEAQTNKDVIEIDRESYESLLSENKFLNKILSDFIKKGTDSYSKNPSPKSETNMKLKTDYGFYVKIIIAITVIMLSLAFHIVYLSVASCLFYSNGSSECWIKSWLGMPVYASFFIDLILYLLIGFQLVLIILILRSKIIELKK